MIPFSCDSHFFDDQVGLIVAKGELDLDTASCLGEQCAELVEKGAIELVVDLSEISFIDSTALGALIGARRRVSGTLAVVAAHPQVLGVLRMTGMDRVFPLVSSREDALECVKKPTKSCRSLEPLRVTGEVTDWQGHSPEALKAMKDGLEELKRQGVEPIDD